MKSLTITGAWIKSADGLPLMLDSLTNDQLRSIMDASARQADSLMQDIRLIAAVISQRRIEGN